MPAEGISIAAKKGTSARPARRLDSLGYNSRDWAERVHGSYWHKVDLVRALPVVRYRRQSGHGALGRAK
jgi:hypothetical protein